jgi:plasmid stabilization system protein ParE
MTKGRAIHLVFTEAAAQAIVEQIEYYAGRQSQSLADRWEKLVARTILSLRNMPKRGTPCYFGHPDLRDLRRIRVSGFPHLIFYRYLPEKAVIQIVHVVHGARDIEAVLIERSEL